MNLNKYDKMFSVSVTGILIGTFIILALWNISRYGLEKWWWDPTGFSIFIGFSVVVISTFILAFILLNKSDEYDEQVRSFQLSETEKEKERAE